MARSHPDHRKKRRDEGSAHEAMVRGRVVQVERPRHGHDGLEVGRTLNGGLQLGHGEIADAYHADIAIRPGLFRRPFNQIVHVLPLLAVKEAESPSRTAGAAKVCNDVDIAARHEEVAGASFDKTHRRAQILYLARIWRRRDEHRITARCRWTKDGGEGLGAVAHRPGHIVFASHFVLRLRQVTVVAARRLRSVQLPLAGFGAGNRFAHLRRSLYLEGRCTPATASTNPERETTDKPPRYPTPPARAAWRSRIDAPRCRRKHSAAFPNRPSPTPCGLRG